MSVEPADTRAGEPVCFDEYEHFIVLGNRKLRQSTQHCKDLRTWVKPSASEFPNDKGVAFNLIVKQQHLQAVIARAQMINPDRGVDQHAG